VGGVDKVRALLNSKEGSLMIHSRVLRLLVASSLSCAILEASPVILEPHLDTPRTIRQYSPLWCDYELVKTADWQAFGGEFYATVDGDPEFTLRRLDAGEQLGHLRVRPRWDRMGVGSFHPSVFTIRDNGEDRERYLVSSYFGVLKPGAYELRAQVYLEVTKSRAQYLPGREAPERGTISGGSVPMVIWALPEQRVTFRVEEAADDAAKTLLDRVRRLAEQDKLRYVEMDDWLSLLLVGTKPAWDFLMEHFPQAPDEARELAAVFLLNYETAGQAIGRASQMLSSSSWWANRIGLDVIEQRGRPGDALLLREVLQTGNSLARREAYFTIARMLGKPTNPELGSRRFVATDAQAALQWLDDLPPTTPRTPPPVTQPQSGIWTLQVPVATRPGETRPAAATGSSAQSQPGRNP
jgi:hypothetical protein